MPKSKLLNPLNERIAELARDRSLSDIARKTGTSVANVSRYTSGTRIPAEFCTDLVKNLGVNPSWVLTGEGAPFLSDVTEGTEKMAGNVLELVEAMNAVAQMRLGALTGKHHLRVLRELNDALERYEDLRERLNEHSRPIFKRILDDLEGALQAHDFQRITELRKAAQQVERLCDDEVLSRRFTGLQAHCEVAELNTEQSILFQQKLVRDSLATGLVNTDEQCEEFARLIVSLQGAGRAEESLRLCRALVELVGEERMDWPGYCMVRFMHGKVLTDRGDLYGGLALMQRYSGGLKGRRAENARFHITDAMLHAGLIEFEEALHIKDKRLASGMRLVEQAMWREDPALIRRALKALSPAVRQVSGYVELPDAAEAVMRAAEGDQDAVDKFIEKVRSQPRYEETLHLLTMRAWLWWLAGNRSKARYWAKKADKALDENPGLLRNAYIVVMARHFRNVLRVGLGGKRGDRALQKLREFARAGYRFVESALDEVEAPAT